MARRAVGNFLKRLYITAIPSNSISFLFSSTGKKHTPNDLRALPLLVLSKQIRNTEKKTEN